jgi:hypothetical protein
MKFLHALDEIDVFQSKKIEVIRIAVIIMKTAESSTPAEIKDRNGTIDKC